jgi:pSer/pThr/pTyr-binding forkhead associated (FHA) protein
MALAQRGAWTMTALRVMEGPASGKRFELEDEILFLGRAAKNDIQINDYTVSRMHLKIFRIGTAVFVEDLKSSNGTLINGMPLEPGEGRQVDETDAIIMGDTVIRLEAVTAREDPHSEGPVASPPREVAEAPRRFETGDRRLRPFRETEFILKLSEHLRGPINLEETLENMLEQILNILPRTDRVAVYIRDNKTGDVKKAAMKTKTDEEADPLMAKSVEEVFAKGKALIVADAAHRESGDAPDGGGTVQIKSLLCLPMTAHGIVFGVLYMDGIKGPYASREEDLLWIETAGTLIACAIENAELSFRMSLIADLCSPRH